MSATEGTEAARWCDHCGTALDGTKADGAKGDDARVDGTALDGVKADGTALDGVKADGTALDGARHAGCEAARLLEPPRYCTRCGGRMKVQVLPASWHATCPRCSR